MTVRQLLLLLLVLLQSGLVVGSAHAHVCASHRQFHQTKSPHVHAHQLLDVLSGDEEHDEHGDEATDEHDSDAFAVSDLTVTSTQSEQDAVSFDLPEITGFKTVAGFAGRSPFLAGLPPAIAGPPRPLYLTFCALRN